jgi:sortase A
LPSPLASPAVRPSRSSPAGQPPVGSPLGRLEIPKIGLVHTVYQGFELAQIDKGPGHWPGSPLPGQPGNVVFAGHRVTYSRPFFDIDKLAAGDEIIFKTPSGTFVYRMTGSLIVKPTDVWVLNATSEATVTLTACHPKFSARQRYVVKAKLTSSAPPP